MSELSRLTDSWAERLFLRMHSHFGKAWPDHWVGLDENMNEVQAVWAESLAGFSGDEIRRGIKSLGKYVPNIEEFKQLCRPPLDPEMAWHEAVNGAWARERGEFGKWTNPAVYWAYVEFGAYELRNRSYKTEAKRWTATLNLCIRIHEEGGLEPIPEPMVALPAPEQAQTSSAEGVEKIGPILDMITRSIVVPQLASLSETEEDKANPLKLRGDHKDWARRMIANPKGKSITSLQMAHNALGIEYIPSRRKE